VTNLGLFSILESLIDKTACKSLVLTTFFFLFFFFFFFFFFLKLNGRSERSIITILLRRDHSNTYLLRATLNESRR
jgi:predicted PurR-regulated permease PerM